jgi:MFS family permease
VNPEKQLSDNSPRFGWVILLVAIFSMGVFTIAFQTVPVIIPQLKEEFSISTTEAGLLMTVSTLPGIFLSLPSGWFFNRYHAKKAGLLASIIIAFSCALIFVSDSYLLMLLGRLIMGFGGNLMLITCLSMISQWFGKGGLGKAMGVYIGSNTLITVATYSGLSLFVTTFNWRFSFFVCAILAATSSVLFLLVVKNSKSLVMEVGVDSKKIFLNINIWKIGLILLCIEVATNSFSIWVPTLYTTFSNMTLVESSLLDSLSIIPTIFLLPFFGYLSDKTGKRRLFLILGSVLMTSTFIGLSFSSHLTTMVIMSLAFFIGVTSTMISPALNTMPREIFGYGKTGIGFGILGICGAVSGVLSSLLMGYLIDITDSLIVPLLSMAAFSAAAIAIALTLKTK